MDSTATLLPLEILEQRGPMTIYRRSDGKRVRVIVYSDFYAELQWLDGWPE